MRWSTFVSSWNRTLAARPTSVISTYLASQSVSWISLYTLLYASPLVVPPDLAVGYMAARLTKRLRQPLNIGVAAGLAQAVPALSQLQVTPLITGTCARRRKRGVSSILS